MEPMGSMMKNGVDYTGYTTEDPTIVALAEKTVRDCEGNIIDETYMKKSESNLVIDNVSYHNSNFRGQDITNRFLDGSLYGDIESGKFTNLFIGDYFTTEIYGVTTKCRLAKFGTRIRSVSASSDSPMIDKNHAFVVPDEWLGTSHWNAEKTTEGAYKNSDVRKFITSKIDPALDEVFGEHLIEYGEYVTSELNTEISSGSCGLAIFAGMASKCELVPTKASLMCEKEVVGTRIFATSSKDYNGIHSRLPLFFFQPDLIYLNETSDRPVHFWLRDITSATGAVIVHYFNYGIMVNSTVTNDMSGVRPKWVIG